MNQRVPFSQRAIAHLKAFFTLCFAVLFSLSSFTAPAWANQDVDQFVFTNQPSVAQTVVADVTDSCNNQRLGAPCTYPVVPGGAITMNFGAGTDRSLDTIVVGGQTFFPDTTNTPNGLANRVEFRRNTTITYPSPNPPGSVAGPATTDGRSLLFYEFNGANPVGNTANIPTGLVDSLEAGMRSRFVNRGVDNIFNNATFNMFNPGRTNLEDTRNNIERVDYIINAGLNIPVASRGDFGFLVLDRGGNDNFGVAAITELNGPVDANGLPTPSAYGTLQPVVPGDFAGSAVATNIATIVTRDDDLSDADSRLVRPSHAVNLQNVQGRFFSIADLDVGAATTIFGYSIFPADVGPGDNLVNFLNFPTTTTGASAQGGLDLIAGGLVLSRVTTPQIGLAKTNSAPRPAGAPGFFDIDLTLRVTNTGNVVLNNVQIVEDLTAALIDNATNQADAFTFQNAVIDASGVTGTAPTLNAAYTGTNTTPGTTDALFALGNSFNVGDTAVVTVTVRVDLGTTIGGPAPLDDGILIANNQAFASGTTPGGQRTTDASQNGTNADPDGDGNPGNNNQPTPIFIPFPSIGVAKSVSAFRPVAGTTQFDFDFTITVTNNGATELTDVALVENLQNALITSATNRVDSFGVVPTPTVTSTGFVGGTPPTINTNYDGVGNTGLFTAGNVFPIGATSTVVVTVRAELGSGGAGPLNDGIVVAQNTATASGQPSGPNAPPGVGRVTDDSQNGANADPDGDGNPANDNTPTPIVFPPATTALVLVKRITNIFRGGVALAVPGITNFNDQATDANDTFLNLALGGGNQLPGLFQLPAGFALQSNDEVEYTITFWNSSVGQISQLNLCDELQPPSVLNTNVAFQLAAVGALGTPTFGAAGTAVQGRSPGAPLEGFCPSAPGSFPLGPPGPTGGLGIGAGGGVVAGPFTVPASQFGAFRFRVRIP